MEANELWDSIDPIVSKIPVDAKKYKMARATIFNSILEDVLFLAKKDKAKDVWMALRTMFLGAERVREARVQSHKEEFDSLKMKNIETAKNYAFKVATLLTKFVNLGRI